MKVQCHDALHYAIYQARTVNMHSPLAQQQTHAHTHTI